MPTPPISPLVSVVIPAFNAAATIGETVDSIRSQAGVDFELIVVDDGSTDDTAAVVRNRDKNAVIINQPNRGRGAARNAGVRAARGAYIYFFDADDLMEPDAIVRLAEWLNQHPNCDVAFGETLVFCGNPESATLREPRCDESGVLLERHLSTPFMTMITSMFRRPLYDAVGGMSEDLKSNEDWHFWLKLSVCGARFEPIGGPPLSRYRTYAEIRGSSLVHPLSGVKALRLLKREYGDRIPREVNIDAHIAKCRADYARALLREGFYLRAWREWLGSLYYNRQHVVANSFVFLTSLIVSTKTAERSLVTLAHAKRKCLGWRPWA